MIHHVPSVISVAGLMRSVSRQAHSACETSTDGDAIGVIRQPIILFGMHRSGTSLVARVLDELGLFQGDELQEDHESTYFLGVNDMLLRRAGASWDQPGALRELLKNRDAFAHTLRCLRDDLSSGWQISEYLGPAWLPQQRTLSTLDRPWGWKDPRTVFTLPLWLRLFPGARLVYVSRNGVDVAASLRRREVKELARRVREYRKKATQLSSHSMLQRAGFKGSARCLTLEGAFSLWEEYVAEAEAALAAVPNQRLVLNYEQFVADPKGQLPGLAEFCGLDAQADAVERAAAGVNAGRANAFMENPELNAFYQRVRGRPSMRRYGYDALTAA
jgi:hypothetical protein